MSNARDVLLPTPPAEDPDVKTVRQALVNIADNVINARKAILSIAKRRGMNTIAAALTQEQKTLGLAILTAGKDLLAAIGEVDPGDPPATPEPVVPDLEP